MQRNKRKPIATSCAKNEIKINLNNNESSKLQLAPYLFELGKQPERFLKGRNHFGLKDLKNGRSSNS